jgi:hypothetical protein
VITTKSKRKLAKKQPVKSMVNKLTPAMDKEQLAQVMANVELYKDGKLPFDIIGPADRAFVAKLETIGIKVRPTNGDDGKGCWLWNGKTALIGSGKIERPKNVRLRGHRQPLMPYRLTVATFIGRDLPSDIHIDHRCKVPGERKATCIRPGSHHCVTVDSKNAKSIERFIDGKQDSFKGSIATLTRSTIAKHRKKQPA